MARRLALKLTGASGGLALAYRLAVQPAAAQQPTFPQAVAQLTRMAEDVWYWNNGGYNSLIAVSDVGALVTEPSSLNPRASTLLKSVIASLTPQPVKYVVFSHDHADHN